MDEELLGGVAGAGALDLGVDEQRLGECEVGGAVDVDEADALVVLDDRDRGVLGDETDERLAAAGDEAVDEVVELEERVERGAVGRGDELDGGRGQAGGGEGLGDQGGEGGVAVEGLLAAAQDGGVTGFQAQRGAVDGDVRPRLVDDADHADGHAELADDDAVGAGGALQFGADGVGQGDDLAHALGHLADAGVVEGETVEQRGGEAGGAAGVEVLGVGGEEGRDGGFDLLGERGERAVLGLGGGDGQFQRGGAGGLGELADGESEIGFHRSTD